MICPSCQARSAAGNRFCLQCGASLGPSSGTKPIQVGRSPDCDVVLTAASVSANHLQISAGQRPGSFLVEDLASTYGTFVAGRRIQKEELAGNTVLHLGKYASTIERLVQSTSLATAEVGQTKFVDVVGGPVVVGRAGSGSFCLPYPMVSGQHLEIRADSGVLMIRDLESSNGTFLDQQRLQSHVWVSLKDKTLQLGSFRVPPATIENWHQELTGTSSQFAAQKTSATIPAAGEVLIGRDPTCDVVVDAPQISWRHARITSQGGRWVVEDLRSSNGVFVNGVRTKRAVIGAKDQLFLGSIQINLDQEKVSAPKRHQGEIRLDGVDLTRRLESGKVILDKVGISIYPGELVALMGPSGAGKTTLLEILTGQKRPSDGQVLVNGIHLHDNLEGLRPRIGYVPQEDIMHRDLTVYEVLFHAAMLRLPADLPHHAIEQHVERLLERMGLWKIRDSLIGGAAKRGISGGQRKRVNIALELITEPPLLFLDEPTSGLDSTSTLEVMQVLRELADSGKTIIATVHQPRIEAFECFDQLLLLSKGGKLAYYGPANPDSAEYFSSRTTMKMRPGINPSDYAIDVLDPLDSKHFRSADAWQKDYLESSHYRRFVVQRRTAEVDIVPPAQTKGSPRQGVDQIKNLMLRYYRRKSRDKMAVKIQLALPILIGILLGILFKDKAVASAQEPGGVLPALFILGLAAFWMGCQNVAREFVADRPVFRRECRSGLSPFAYLSATFVLQVAMTIVQTFVLMAIAWKMLGVDQGHFVNVWSVLILTAAAGVASGLLISAISPSEVTAITFVPILLLPQLLFSGFLRRYNSMSEGQQQITDFVPLRWAFEAICRLEYSTAFPGEAAYRLQGRAVSQGSAPDPVAIGFPEASQWAGPNFLLVWTAICLVICFFRLQATQR